MGHNYNSNRVTGDISRLRRISGLPSTNQLLLEWPWHRYGYWLSTFTGTTELSQSRSWEEKLPLSSVLPDSLYTQC